MVCAARFVKQGLSLAAYSGYALTLGKDRTPLSREDRLAAKLRENLRRRKAQARARRAGEADGRDGLPSLGVEAGKDSTGRA